MIPRRLVHAMRLVTINIIRSLTFYGQWKSGFISYSWFCFSSIQAGKLDGRLVLFVLFASILVPSIARYQLLDIHSPGTWILTMIVIMRVESIGFGVLWHVLWVSHQLHGKEGKDPAFAGCGHCFVLFPFLVIYKGEQYMDSATLTKMFFFPLSIICVMVRLTGYACIRNRRSSN